MSDDDLISRMDAMQACQVGPSDEWSKSTRDGYNQAATDCAMNMLRVPAVQPDACIEALTAERDNALNHLDSEGYSVEVLEKRVAKFMADNARLREALTGIKRAAAHRMQDDPKDLHSYYFHTAAAALNTGKEPSHE